MNGDDYKKGLKAGRIDALLEEHSIHLKKINGSVERFAIATESLTEQIRIIQEDSRLDRERVKVAADTLATETERRRKEIESSTTNIDRKFSKREKIVGVVLTIAGLATAWIFK